ncbi:response regulator [Paraburkholderia sp. GAS199]|uniref:response regulator n=1 Tax=Paraburkholderia sp. GAS199 TaxID=3035126 RepID=UPI003D1F6C1F
MDDEPEMLEAWSFALEYSGFIVERASDGRDAIASLQRQTPDLVITDLMMPGMNGEELCRAIRSNPDWADLPVILHSSARVTTASAPGLWDAVIRKPAQLEVLLHTIETLRRR